MSFWSNKTQIKKAIELIEWFHDWNSFKNWQIMWKFVFVGLARERERERGVPEPPLP